MCKIFKILLLVLLLCLVVFLVQVVDGVVGCWKIIDDKIGKVKLIVEIIQVFNGMLIGKVVDILYLDKGLNLVCDGCEGVNRNKLVKGMIIFWNLKVDGVNKWFGGIIFDLVNGKIYKLKMELQFGGIWLDVFGCIVFICCVQIWQCE